MSACEANKHIFETRLTRGQAQQMLSLFLDPNQQSRDGQVWLVHIQTDETVVLSHGLDSWKRPPNISGIAVRVATHLKFHHVVPAQALDQIRRRAFGNHLSMIDNG